MAPDAPKEVWPERSEETREGQRGPTKGGGHGAGRVGVHNNRGGERKHGAVEELAAHSVVHLARVELLHRGEAFGPLVLADGPGTLAGLKVKEIKSCRLPISVGTPPVCLLTLPPSPYCEAR